MSSGSPTKASLRKRSTGKDKATSESGVPLPVLSLDGSTPPPTSLRHHPTCNLCPLRTDATLAPCVPTRHLGQPPSPTTDMILVVGHRLGVRENQTGISFTGESGDLLTTGYLRDELNLESRAAIYLANVTRCFNPADTIPIGQYRTCFTNYMIPDVQYLTSLPARHRAILCLGAVAARYFFELAGFPRLRLRDVLGFQATPLPPWTLFVTYHPANLLVAPEYARITEVHLYLLDLFLHDRLPSRSQPTIVPPHNPWRFP